MNADIAMLLKNIGTAEYLLRQMKDGHSKECGDRPPAERRDRCICGSYERDAQIDTILKELGRGKRDQDEG